MFFLILVSFFDLDFADRDPVVRVLHLGHGSLGTETDLHFRSPPHRIILHSGRIPRRRKRRKTYPASSW